MGWDWMPEAGSGERSVNDYVLFLKAFSEAEDIPFPDCSSKQESQESTQKYKMMIMTMMMMMIIMLNNFIIYSNFHFCFREASKPLKDDFGMMFG